MSSAATSAAFAFFLCSTAEEMSCSANFNKYAVRTLSPCVGIALPFMCGDLALDALCLAYLHFPEYLHCFLFQQERIGRAQQIAHLLRERFMVDPIVVLVIPSETQAFGRSLDDLAAFFDQKH